MTSQNVSAIPGASDSIRCRPCFPLQCAVYDGVLGWQTEEEQKRKMEFHFKKHIGTYGTRGYVA